MMTERQKKIIALLQEIGRMEVTSLAEALQVSAVTARKDIAALEALNLLQRKHGYIERVSGDDIGYRMTHQYEIKQRIAIRAAVLVQNGDTIMIESGSTCAMLAIELAQKRQDVTIITNSAYIAETVRRLQGAKVILLGGAYDSEAQVTTGPLIPLCAGQFYVNRFFIGIDGFDTVQGFFSNADMQRAGAVQAMAQRADQTIILTDSSKFNRRSVVKLLHPSEVAAIITDEVPDNCKAALEAAGVRIILA